MRGGQWQALYLILGLAQEGYPVRLLAPANSPLLHAALAQQLDARPLHIATLPKSLAGAEIIHAHDARAHTLAVLTAKPVVVSRRVGFSVKRNAASRWKYRRAAHFIAVSKFVEQKLVEGGVDPRKIAVVYDGVPLNISNPGFGYRSRVVALDSNDPGKGKHIVQQAADIAGIPVDFSSNLIGDLKTAAVFIYITDLEGLGSAALLAMAAGVPVLASRVGGLPEIVEDGVTGLLTSNDPDEVAKGIRRLLTDRALASDLAARARMRVEKEFSIERMVKETLQVYERILG